MNIGRDAATGAAEVLASSPVLVSASGSLDALQHLSDCARSHLSRLDERLDDVSGFLYSTFCEGEGGGTPPATLTREGGGALATFANAGPSAVTDFDWLRRSVEWQELSAREAHACQPRRSSKRLSDAAASAVSSASSAADLALRRTAPKRSRPSGTTASVSRHGSVSMERLLARFDPDGQPRPMTAGELTRTGGMGVTRAASWEFVRHSSGGQSLDSSSPPSSSGLQVSRLDNLDGRRVSGSGDSVPWREVMISSQTQPFDVAIDQPRALGLAYCKDSRAKRHRREQRVIDHLLHNPSNSALHLTRSRSAEAVTSAGTVSPAPPDHLQQLASKDATARALRSKGTGQVGASRLSREQQSGKDAAVGRDELKRTLKRAIKVSSFFPRLQDSLVPHRSNLAR